MGRCVSEQSRIGVDFDQLWVQIGIEQEVEAKELEAPEFPLKFILDRFKEKPAYLVASFGYFLVKNLCRWRCFWIKLEHVFSHLIHRHDCLLFLLFEFRVELLDGSIRHVASPVLLAPVSEALGAVLL